MKRLAFSCLLASSVSVSAYALSTKNAMPPGTCEETVCAQGALATEAFIFAAKGNASVAFIQGAELKGTEWSAGRIPWGKSHVVKTMSKLCIVKLRGSTILKVLQELVSSKHVHADNGATDNRMLQYSGVRLTYSTSLPAAARLTKVEWWDKDAMDSGAYVPLDRTKVYGVAISDSDRETNLLEAYTKLWKEPTLAGESYSCSWDSHTFWCVNRFLVDNPLYTVPAVPESRLLSVTGGTAIVVDHNATYCKGIRQVLNASVYSCVPCPVGEVPDAAGVACEKLPANPVEDGTKLTDTTSTDTTSKDKLGLGETSKKGEPTVAGSPSERNITLNEAGPHDLENTDVNDTNNSSLHMVARSNAPAVRFCTPIWAATMSGLIAAALW